MGVLPKHPSPPPPPLELFRTYIWTLYQFSALRCENNPLHQINPFLKIQWEIYFLTFFPSIETLPNFFRICPRASGPWALGFISQYSHYTQLPNGKYRNNINHHVTELHEVPLKRYCSQTRDIFCRYKFDSVTSTLHWIPKYDWMFLNTTLFV